MKKRVVSLVLAAAMSSLLLPGCSSSDEPASGTPDTDKAEETVFEEAETSGLTKVVLNEVAHSIFYAPMYVAIEEGYFEEEGIELDVVTGFGADKTMTAVLSGEADIGFMGSDLRSIPIMKGQMIMWSILLSLLSGQVISWWQEKKWNLSNGRI